MTFGSIHPYLSRSAYGKCCFKCANRPTFDDGKAHTLTELTCSNNPDMIGDTRFCCDSFELDKTRWYNVNYQRYEVENYKKHYGVIPIEVFL